MDTTSILGTNINWEYFDFTIRFLINLVSIIIVSGLIYLRRYRENENFFVITTFNIVVFFICFLLSNVQLSMGFAFGIFAVFSLLRYRTKIMQIKEMTFLFTAISLAIINAIHYDSFSTFFIIFSNIVIIATIYILELIWTKSEKSKDAILDKIELIKPEHYSKLLEDMKVRTGLNITRVEIGKIDFVKDIAQIKIFFSESHAK